MSKCQLVTLFFSIVVVFIAVEGQWLGVYRTCPRPHAVNRTEEKQQLQTVQIKVINSLAYRLTLTTPLHTVHTANAHQSKAAAAAEKKTKLFVWAKYTKVVRVVGKDLGNSPLKRQQQQQQVKMGNG